MKTNKLYFQPPRCVEVVDRHTVQLNPPETSRAYTTGRQVSKNSLLDNY